jgi:hypothetical protein
MTTIDFISSNEVFRGFPKKQGQLYTISIANDPELYITHGLRGRGGQGLGKFNKVREFYINKENRIYAGFLFTDSSGHSYRYIPIGRLHVIKEEDL